MSEKEGLLTRLRVKLTPQFAEDWAGSAGKLFRTGLARVVEYNRKHAKVGEKIDEAPSKLWRAADGATSIQHAQAQKAYAEAEEINMRTELGRRMMDSTVAKGEAEAEQAKIAALQARAQLFKTLKELDVAFTTDGSMNITIEPAPPTPTLQIEDVLDEAELAQIRPKLVPVRLGNLGAFSIEETPARNIEWLVAVGTKVNADEQIGIIELSTSPPSAHQIRAKSSGVITYLLNNKRVKIVSTATVLAQILPDQ